jgi:hypothetical protein
MNHSKISKSFCRFFKAANDTELNYMPSMLTSVDVFLQGLGDTNVSEGIKREMATAAGIYVGEVLIRNLGGDWDQPSDAEVEHRYKVTWTVKLPSGAIANPILKAKKIASQISGEANSLTNFYDWCATFGCAD